MNVTQVDTLILNIHGVNEKNHKEYLVYPVFRPWFEAKTFRKLSIRWNNNTDINNVVKVCAVL